MSQHNEWDTNLSRAFQNEASPDPTSAQARRKETVLMYGQKMRRLKAYLMFYLALLLVSMLTYAVIFILAQSLKVMIGFAVLALVMYEGMVLMRLWFEVTVSKITVLEEIKQLRLDVAELSRRSPLSEEESPAPFRADAVAAEASGAVAKPAKWRGWAWNLALGLCLAGMIAAPLCGDYLPTFLLGPHVSAKGAFSSSPVQINLPKRWIGPDASALIKIRMEGWEIGKMNGDVCKTQGHWALGTYDIMTMGQGYGTFDLRPGTWYLTLDPGGKPGTYEVLISPSRYLLLLCSKWGVFLICFATALGLCLWRLDRIVLRGI